MSLQEILLNTLNKEKVIRDRAEVLLNEACSQSGYVTSLLEIAASNNIPKEVRQAAAVALKNGIRKNWTSPSDDVHGQPIPFQDRTTVRAHIIKVVGGISPEHDSIRKLLAECVGYISEVDLSQNWPEFVTQLLEELGQSTNLVRIHNSLLILKSVVKRFEFKRTPRKVINPNGNHAFPEEDKRAPINALVNVCFPILLTYGEHFVTAAEDHFAVMLKLIAKIFALTTRLEMPPYLLNEESTIHKWFRLWSLTIAKPLTDLQSMGDDIDDLSLRPWLKAKKVALEISVRTFSRCVDSDLSFVSDSDAQSLKFRKAFIKDGIASQLLVECVKLLEQWTRLKKPLPERLLQLLLSYCATALSPSETYKLLRPNLQFLVDEVVVQCLCFTQKDFDLWQEDPETYAARDLDPLDDMFNYKATACQLLVEACQKRSKDVLDGTVTFLLQELGQRRDGPRQDACLFAVGALADVLCPAPIMDSDDNLVPVKLKKRMEKYRGHLETLLARFVVPELNAKEMYVRSRACWVIGRYCYVEFKSRDVALQAFGGLLDRLGDTQLPVQAQAAASLKNVLLLDPESSLGAKALREVAVRHLGLIIDKYLFVMNKVGADDVVAGLQALITCFHIEITPMACNICHALVETFFHYVSEEAEDEEGEFASAALETLDAIASLLEVCADKPVIMDQMALVVLPLVKHILNPKLSMLDYLDNAVSIYSFLTFYCSLPLHDEIWTVVGLMKQCFDQFAFDYLNEMAMPLEHLAFREPNKFFAGKDVNTNNQTYCECAYLMCKKVMEDTNAEEGAGEIDLRSATTILSAIIQAAPVNAEELQLLPITAICKQCTYWLFQQNAIDLSKSTKSKFFEVIESCFYNSPKAVLQLFGNQISLGLTKLRESLSFHKLIQKKKVALLGMLSLLNVLFEQNPNVDLQSYVLAMCCEILMNMERQKEHKLAVKNGNKEMDDEDGEDGEEEEGGDDDEEEVEENQDADKDAEEEAYNNYLKAHGDDFGEGVHGDLDGDDDDDEESIPDDYFWPMNEIDEKAVFKRVIHMHQAKAAKAVLKLDGSIQEALKILLQ